MRRKERRAEDLQGKSGRDGEAVSATRKQAKARLPGTLAWNDHRVMAEDFILFSDA